MAAENGEVGNGQDNHQQRQDGHVEREEAGQSMMSVDRPAHDDLLQPGSQHRQIARDVRGDLRGPIAFLVPRKQVASQTQPQHAAQQRQPQPPIHLARRQVSASDNDLQHVDAEQHNHRLRAEMV